VAQENVVVFVKPGVRMLRMPNDLDNIEVFTVAAAVAAQYDDGFAGVITRSP
jgi:hypothetical protein